MSGAYNSISPPRYYERARNEAIRLLNIKTGNAVLNVACGTGQNFPIIQQYLRNEGKIIGLDFSKGMLDKASLLIQKNDWKNIHLVYGDANNLSTEWLQDKLGYTAIIDSTICDLGLTAIPNWKNVIDRMLKVTIPGGPVVIMDWHMKKLTLRGRLVNWIGAADITRPIWQYLESKTTDFTVDHSFKNGDLFVASGFKIK